MITSIEKIKEAGFTGFRTIEKLWNDHSSIPKEKGIYLVLANNELKQQFLPKGIGGHFKGKDPNVSLEELKTKWVIGAQVIYIGQSGGKNSNSTLAQRIKCYIDFGKGKPVGHYGGRHIWQLEKASELQIAWKVIRDEDPCTIERELLSEFHNFYGKLPFANRRM